MAISPQFSDYREEARFYFHRANEYEESGNLDQALEECDLAIRIDPDLPDAYNLRGIILENLGDTRNAIHAYEKAIKLDPDFIEAKENLQNLVPDEVRGNQNLVIAAKFSHPIEANLAKAKLESEGIFSFVADENMVTTNWLYSYAMGGVRLLVPEADFERALVILNHTASPDELPEEFFSETKDLPNCPKCGGKHIHYETFDPRAVFASQLITLPFGTLGIPLPFRNKKFKCDNCGFRWKWEEASDPDTTK